jgi:hypothetical protein
MLKLIIQNRCSQTEQLSGQLCINIKNQKQKMCKKKFDLKLLKLTESKVWSQRTHLLKKLHQIFCERFDNSYSFESTIIDRRRTIPNELAHADPKSSIHFRHKHQKSHNQIKQTKFNLKLLKLSGYSLKARDKKFKAHCMKSRINEQGLYIFL